MRNWTTAQTIKYCLTVRQSSGDCMSPVSFSTLYVSTKDERREDDNNCVKQAAKGVIIVSISFWFAIIIRFDLNLKITIPRCPSAAQWRCCFGCPMPGWLCFFPNGWICRVSATWTQPCLPESTDQFFYSVYNACVQQVWMSFPMSAVLSWLVMGLQKG